jgi:hypothetical protein
MHPLDQFKAELRGAPMAQMMPCHHCLKYTNHYAIGRPHEFCSWVVYECNNCEGTKEVDV